MPVGKTESSPLHRGHLQVGTTTSFAERSDLRAGTGLVSNAMDQSTRAWVVTGELGYGLTNSVALQASVPLLNVTFIEGPNEQADTKLGDLSVVVQRYWRRGHFATPTLISVGVGVNIPTGQGIENPISSDRNFVSGTLDPIITGSIVKSFEGPFSLIALVYGRPILGEDDQSSRSGSFLLYSIGGSYSLHASDNMGVDFSLRLTGLERAHDRVSRETFPNSGGSWLFLSPGATVALGGTGIHGLQLWSNLEIPIYQSVNGTQLTESWGVRFGLNLGIHIF